MAHFRTLLVQRLQLLHDDAVALSLRLVFFRHDVEFLRDFLGIYFATVCGRVEVGRGRIRDGLGLALLGHHHVFHLFVQFFLFVL